MGRRSPAPRPRRRSAARTLSYLLPSGPELPGGLEFAGGLELTGRPEPVPVFRRCDAGVAVKRAAEGLGGAEAIPPGDGRHRIVGFGERTLRRLDARALHVGRGWAADLGCEPPLQVPGAQPGMPSQ